MVYIYIFIYLFFVLFCIFTFVPSYDIYVVPMHLLCLVSAVSVLIIIITVTQLVKLFIDILGVPLPYVLFIYLFIIVFL